MKAKSADKLVKISSVIKEIMEKNVWKENIKFAHSWLDIRNATRV